MIREVLPEPVPPIIPIVSPFMALEAYIPKEESASADAYDEKKQFLNSTHGALPSVATGLLSLSDTTWLHSENVVYSGIAEACILVIFVTSIAIARSAKRYLVHIVYQGYHFALRDRACINCFTAKPKWTAMIAKFTIT